MITITVLGKEYELATTLRVAYIVQGQHNHKSYIDVFSSIDKMSIEEQVGILYAAFVAANKEESKTITKSVFTNAVMDTFDLSMLMEKIKDVISGVMGKELSEQAEKQSKDNSGDSTEDFQEELGMEYLEEELKQD